MSARPIDPAEASSFAALADLFGLDPAARAWRAFAACRGRTDINWTPERGDWQSIAAAKAVCAACPVAEPCLAVAVRNNEVGTWGGTSAQERRSMRSNAITSGTLAADIIAELASRQGKTWHGTSGELARTIGHGETQTSRAVADLERKGVVTVVRKGQGHGAAKTVRSITLNDQGDNPS